MLAGASAAGAGEKPRERARIEQPPWAVGSPSAPAPRATSRGAFPSCSQLLARGRAAPEGPQHGEGMAEPTHVRKPGTKRCEGWRTTPPLPWAACLCPDCINFTLVLDGAAPNRHLGEAFASPVPARFRLVGGGCPNAPHGSVRCHTSPREEPAPAPAVPAAGWAPGEQLLAASSSLPGVAVAGPPRSC